VNNKKHKETLLYIWSLKERAEKLREKANNWEVKPNINKRIKKIDTYSRFLGKIIKIASKPELTEKEKKQLIGLTKRRLTLFKKHFLSVYNLLKKSPDRAWDRKIKSTETELEERLDIYKKIIPLLFREKSKKSKRKK